MLIQLSILDGPDGGILVANRLVTAGDVDDAERANTERDAVSEIGTAVIWTPVTHHVRHPVECLPLDHWARRTRDLNNPADATHRLLVAEAATTG